MVRDKRIRETLRMLLMMIESRASVSFEEAVGDFLQARKGRRPRTVAELRSVSRRWLRSIPWLASCRVDAMGRGECTELVQVGTTPRQQRKLRTILHGFFEHCRRQVRKRAIPAAPSAPSAILSSIGVPIFPLPDTATPWLTRS